MRRLIPALAVLTATLYATAAGAVVTQVSVQPPMSNMPAGRSGTVTLRWDVTTLTGGGGPNTGASVRSTQGVFRAGGPQGQILGVNPQVIQGVARLTPQQTAVANIVEAVPIPERVALRAQRLGVTQVIYQRDFDDGTIQQGPGSQGNASFNLSGGQGAVFAVTRVALRFPDGSREQVLAPEAEVFVLADITNTGTGRFEARWEVAQPSSSRGEPTFRVLSLVRRQLTGSGTRTTIRSPSLPTTGDGTYLIRLRITNPDIGFELPVLRYLVNPALAPAPAPEPIVALTPAAGSTYTPGMEFSWRPLTDAAVYRLEFHDTPPEVETGGTGPADTPGELSDTPVSGIVVTAPTDSTELSRVALSHLPTARVYWWRVVAFDAEGRLIGSSELQQLRIPEAGR